MPVACKKWMSTNPNPFDLALPASLFARKGFGLDFVDLDWHLFQQEDFEGRAKSGKKSNIFTLDV